MYADKTKSYVLKKHNRNENAKNVEFENDVNSFLAKNLPDDILFNHTLLIKSNPKIQLMCNGFTIQEWLKSKDNQFLISPIDCYFLVADALISLLPEMEKLMYVHNDISEKNVMLCQDSNSICFAKIIDFGMTRPKNSSKPITGQTSCDVEFSATVLLQIAKLTEKEDLIKFAWDMFKLNNEIDAWTKIKKLYKTLIANYKKVI